MSRKDPKTAFSILAVVFTLLGVGWVVSECTDKQQAALLEREGAFGTARVLSFEETGVMTNKRPRIRFRFEIQPEQGGAPILLEKAIVVSTMDAPRLQVGSMRKVRYLPADPDVLQFLD